MNGLRHACLLCAAPLDGMRLELGPQPPCNRFATAPDAGAPRWPLAVTQCAACRLVQLDPLPPLEALVPRLPWIRYNEPDGHLDAVAAQLARQLAGRVAGAIGVGPFDGPLLDRLGAAGFAVERADLLALAPAAAPGTYPYLETIQARLAGIDLDALRPARGAPRLVACRYLLEHCHRPVAALQRLGRLAGPGGRVLVEVPDSTRFMALRDYSFLWEEHSCYFDAATFAAMLRRAGLALVALERFPGRLEDALVAIAEPEPVATPQPALPPEAAAAPSAPFAAYASAFPALRAAYRAALDTSARGGGSTVLFGAGHQAVMFINALGLSDRIAYLVDDDPDKQGHFVPGTAIPIRSSATLRADPAVVECLLAVAPRVEARIRENLDTLAARGVRFRSIFAGSDLAIRLDAAPCH